jgi:phage baseplate assembly protein V
MDEITQIKADVAGLKTALEGLLRTGEVTRVDEENHRVKVKNPDWGGVATDWLPVLTRWSRGNRSFSLPKTGEQVLCLFYPFSLSQGFAVAGLFSREDRPPVGDKHKVNLTASDEAVFEYDTQEHKLRIDLPEGAVIEIGGAESPQVARVGDSVDCHCGETGTISTGSSLMKVGG